MQAKTFNIALPQTLVEKIDDEAQKEFRNRSELIREAVRVYLQEKEEWESLFAYGRRQGQKSRVKSEADVNRLVYRFRHGRR